MQGGTHLFRPDDLLRVASLSEHCKEKDFQVGTVDRSESDTQLDLGIYTKRLQVSKLLGRRTIDLTIDWPIGDYAESASWTFTIAYKEPGLRYPPVAAFTLFPKSVLVTSLPEEALDKPLADLVYADLTAVVEG